MRYTITFFIDKEADKPDGRLRCRIRWQRNSLAFLVGYRVNPDKWSQDTQRCTKNSTHGKDSIPAHIINTQIEKIESVIRDTLLPYTLDSVPDKTEIKRILDKKIFCRTSADPKDDFIEVYDCFKNDRNQKSAWTHSTLERYEVIKNHIKRNWPNLKLSTLPSDFPQTFCNHFIDNSYNNRTTKRYVRFLLTFLLWAEKNGYYHGNAHRTFEQNLKIVKRKVIYLTWDELMKFMTFPIPDKKRHLETSRDTFCFSCFTGLRYSDVSRLKWEDVTDNYIYVVTQKTNDSLRIDLNKYSRLILERYRQPDGENSGLIFHAACEQRANKYLKELAQLVGLDEPIKMTHFIGSKRIEETKPKYEYITTHCAKRTFVVAAIGLGIPIEIIMEWCGNKDYKSLSPYLEIIDKVKQEAMSRFDKME